jgi:hypothetical protein
VTSFATAAAIRLIAAALLVTTVSKMVKGFADSALLKCLQRLGFLIKLVTGHT